MIVGAASKRPVEFAFRFFDRQVVDAGVANLHQAVGIKLPVFVAVGAKPIARVVVPFVGITYRNPVVRKSPQLFDKTVFQFFGPFANEKCLGFAAVSPISRLFSFRPGMTALTSGLARRSFVRLKIRFYT